MLQCPDALWLPCPCTHAHTNTAHTANTHTHTHTPHTHTHTHTQRPLPSQPPRAPTRHASVVVNQPPAGANKTFTFLQGAPLQIANADLLAGASPGPPYESSQALTAAPLLNSSVGPRFGVLAPAPNGGAFTYTPHSAAFAGSDRFVFYVQDDGGVDNGGVDTSGPLVATIRGACGALGGMVSAWRARARPVLALASAGRTLAIELRAPRHVPVRPPAAAPTALGCSWAAGGQQASAGNDLPSARPQLGSAPLPPSNGLQPPQTYAVTRLACVPHQMSSMRVTHPPSTITTQ